MAVEYNAMHLVPARDEHGEIIWSDDEYELHEWVEELVWKTWVPLDQVRERWYRMGHKRGAYLVEREISEPRPSKEPPIVGPLGFLFGNQNKPTTIAPWARALFATVGHDRAKSVYRALTKVLHPDNHGTGDDILWRELHDAFQKYEETS